MLDFHNHLIPGVDDGAATLEESLSGIETMKVQGITRIITTPHFRASTIGNASQFRIEMSRIDDGWRILESAVRINFPGLIIERGVELALDDATVVVNDRRLCLGASRFILVEFPDFIVPANSGRALARMRQGGLTPIVAHPERYRNIDQRLEVLLEWKQSGALLQSNAGSIVGAYGSNIERLAWRCFEIGIVDYVCSDYHSRGKCLITQAGARFTDRGGDEHFRYLARVNGDRLVDGLDPLPVAPLPFKKSLWRRLAAGIRGKH